MSPIKFVNAGFLANHCFKLLNPESTPSPTPTHNHTTHTKYSHLYIHDYFHINKTRTKNITIGSSVSCPVLSFFCCNHVVRINRFSFLVVYANFVITDTLGQELIIPFHYVIFCSRINTNYRVLDRVVWDIYKRSA